MIISFNINAQVDTNIFYSKRQVLTACQPEISPCKTLCCNKNKLFNKYVSLSGGFSDANDLFGSLELGLWGKELPLMLAISYDRVRNTGTTNNFLGVKTYFEFYSKLNNYLFVYVSPKSTPNFDSHLIEYGISYYYYINENFYPSVNLGFQKSIPSFSFGLNYVR